MDTLFKKPKYTTRQFLSKQKMEKNTKYFLQQINERDNEIMKLQKQLHEQQEQKKKLQQQQQQQQEQKQQQKEKTPNSSTKYSPFTTPGSSLQCSRK